MGWWRGVGLEGLGVSFCVEQSEGRLVSQMFLLRLQMFLLRLQQPAWCPCPEWGWAVPALGDAPDLQHSCANPLYSSAPAGSGRPRPTLPCWVSAAVTMRGVQSVLCAEKTLVENTWALPSQHSPAPEAFASLDCRYCAEISTGCYNKWQRHWKEHQMQGNYCSSKSMLQSSLLFTCYSLKGGTTQTSRGKKSTEHQ